eukprot:8352058-Lingulodinium_polyedra.AAC.1
MAELFRAGSVQLEEFRRVLELGHGGLTDTFPAQVTGTETPVIDVEEDPQAVFAARRRSWAARLAQGPLAIWQMTAPLGANSTRAV